MTSTIDTAPQVADDPPQRRRRWPSIVVGVIVLALVAAGTSAVVYAHTYSPLGTGNFTGPTVGALHGLTDGVTDPTQYVVVGPPGSTGSIAFSLANNGSHPVTILGSGIPLGEGEAKDISLSWADPYDSNGSVVGVRPSDPRHQLPVTIAPHKEIALIVTVTKAQCPAGVTRSLDQIPIKTLALHVHHVWNYALDDSTRGLAPIDVCSANSALTHLSKS